MGRKKAAAEIRLMGTAALIVAAFAIVILLRIAGTCFMAVIEWINEYLRRER